ncbi:MAG: hypothetical protein ACXWZU_08855 [Actinomycetota bacterium]
MEPGAQRLDGRDEVDAAGEPTERERAIRASALGAALGAVLALVASRRGA